MSANGIEKKTIDFENHNKAVAVSVAANTDAKAIVAALDIKSCEAVILVLGGADSVDEKLIPRLTQLFGRGVARAAVEAKAVIIDGGTQAGVMAMMGEGVAGRGNQSLLVGVAPAGLVSYPGGPTAGTPLEPNHSHFVLVEGKTWGSETSTMFNLASVLMNRTTEAEKLEGKPPLQGADKAVKKAPGIAILAGGGPVSKDEVLRAIRQNLSLIVIEGSGGLADEIAAAWKAKATLPDDPMMAEIIADGDIHLHPLSNTVKGIERLIIRELGIDKVLMQAWENFADYDLNAGIQQRSFNRLQLAILIIGVIGTALAISKEAYPASDAAINLIIHKSLYLVLIIIPILLTILITALNRFKQGTKWLLLRAGAESIKREIYRYRARSDPYDKDAPEQMLAEKIEDITRRTMRTEVNLSALVRYSNDRGFPPDMDAAQGIDDGFSYLSPDRYVEVRLGDQLSYFKNKSLKIERQLKWLYWLTFIIGGVGTFLAAIDVQIWIALTTAVVAAIGTYMGYKQTENTLTKYNQAATDLANVKAWWNALSAEEQSLQLNINSLVAHTEQVLQSELDGWVQQMQNSLAELRKDQAPKKEKEEKGEPEEPPAPQIKPPDKQGEASSAQANNKPSANAETPVPTDAGQQTADTGESEESQSGANETTDSLAGDVADDATTDQPDGQADDGTNSDDHEDGDTGKDLPPPGK